MSEKGVFGPLNFTECLGVSFQEQLYPSSFSLPCLFCNKLFTLYTEKSEYLTHLYLEHRLIIGDEDDVAILHDYLTYWREVFVGDDKKIGEFCTTIIMDQLPSGKPSKNEKYFLLCDVTPQDNEIRQKLRRKRLELALAQHQFERKDNTFERNCLFCRDIIKSTRKQFIEHLFSKHFMQLGKPENLVFIDELIKTVQLKLDSLICIFCEKIFKDRSTLKEHMRKKGHKRINPENNYYDRFFLSFYQNESTNYQQRKKSHAKSYKNTVVKALKSNIGSVFERDSDSNWSDWEEENQEVTLIHCLYCDKKSEDFMKLKNHMKFSHGIDFDQQTESLSFYNRVKIVNFVRRKMYTLECIKCNERCENVSKLNEHLKENKHYSLGTDKDWNMPEYFFPTYEDDAFLCHLDDSNIEDENYVSVDESDHITIYTEDTTVAINVDAEALSKEHFPK
ncbi:zinc finger protein 277 [Contarinia nasturtii]|uniref:zinc finger protein 277 n=1 Tax=Contarinia nasturtii TaxID=265458 RepID=UPI0012D3B0A3|nr:zinc finger protein 277 [Contarinia nasturtii]